VDEWSRWPISIVLETTWSLESTVFNDASRITSNLQLIPVVRLIALPGSNQSHRRAYRYKKGSFFRGSGKVYVGLAKPRDYCRLYSLCWEDSFVPISFPQKELGTMWWELLALKQARFTITLLTVSARYRYPGGRGLSSSAHSIHWTAITSLFGLPVSILVLYAESESFAESNCGNGFLYGFAFGKGLPLLDCRVINISDSNWLRRFQLVLVNSRVSTFEFWLHKRRELWESVLMLKVGISWDQRCGNIAYSDLRKSGKKFPIALFKGKMYHKIIGLIGLSGALQWSLLAFGIMTFTQALSGFGSVVPLTFGEKAQEIGICFGSRMMGGGFGGCTFH